MRSPSPATPSTPRCARPRPQRRAGRGRAGLRERTGCRSARDRARRRSRRRPSTSASAEIIDAHGRIDVVVHNAGHMAFGPAEAFTPGAVRRALRRQRALHPARQPRGPAAYAQAARRAAGLGVLVEQPPAARRPIWRPISPRRPAWMRSPCNMRASCRAGASRPRSSCPAPSRAAPIISRTRASPRTRRAPPNTRPVPTPASPSRSRSAFDRIVPGGRRPRPGRRRHRSDRRHAVWRAPVPRAYRSERRRRLGRLCRHRSRPQRDAQPGRLLRSPEAAPPGA